MRRSALRAFAGPATTACCTPSASAWLKRVQCLLQVKLAPSAPPRRPAIRFPHCGAPRCASLAHACLPPTPALSTHQSKPRGHCPCNRFGRRPLRHRPCCNGRGRHASDICHNKGNHGLRNRTHHDQDAIFPNTLRQQHTPTDPRTAPPKSYPRYIASPPSRRACPTTGQDRGRARSNLIRWAACKLLGWSR
jgi:hypothetical protein